MNLAKLNHVLIPSTKAGRDRLRKSLFGRLFGPLLLLYPATTEEGRLVAFLTLLAVFAGFEVGTTQIYLVATTLSGLLVASFAVRFAYRMKGVRLTIDVPRRVIQGQELRCSLELHNDGDRDHHSVVFRGPFLPWDGAYTKKSRVLPTVRKGKKARVEVRMRFEERGAHHLDPFIAGALTPFGLFLGPFLSSTGSRFLVVPRLASVQRLRTPMGRRYQPGGVALASKTGESMELLGVRPYRPGDMVRDLHARSSARLGVPVVREYVQEYFTRVAVVLDTDGTVATQAKLEAAVSLAAGLVAYLSRGEALIDVLVVGDKVHPLTLGRSLGFLEQALDLLACVEAGPKLSGARLSAALAEHLPRLSCVVLVTLAWDAERAQVIDRVRVSGAGARVLVVRGEGEANAPAMPDTSSIPAGAIARGEALSL